jgi:hypothetical protein
VTPFVALLLWLQVGTADPVAGGGGGSGAVDVDLASAAASGSEGGGGLMMMSNLVWMLMTQSLAGW